METYLGLTPIFALALPSLRYKIFCLESIKFEIKNTSDIPPLNLDRQQIKQALINLIENAIHNTPQGGSVRLLLSPQHGNVAVQVSDTGRGIPTEDLSHIFNRFYQLEKSRKSELGHSGLGLAITKKILELHDRTIDVVSTLGSGTTFSFQLPVEPAA